MIKKKLDEIRTGNLRLTLFSSQFSYSIVFHRFGQLNFLLVVRCRLEPDFTTAPAASKNDTQFKSGQIQLKNNQLTLLI